MTTQTASPNSSVASKAKLKADRPTRILPTDRVQFQKQLLLLRAYAAVSGQSNRDAKIAEVANVAKLNPSTVSLCNGFFVDLGFLERVANGGFTPSPEVQAFHRAFNWKPETAAYKLAPKLRGAWFYLRLLPKLALGALSEDDAIHDLADSASAGKAYEGQLMLVLDYMEAAGLIRRDGGMLRDGPTAQDDDADRSPSVAAPASTPASVASTVEAPARVEAPTQQGLHFTVNVNIDMAEISTWSPARITAFFDGVAKVLAAKNGEVAEPTK